MKFALTDTNGTRTVYTLKTFGELTLADYGKFHCEPWPTDIVEEYEHAIEYISRTTGAPKTKLRRLPVGQVERLATIAFAAMGKIKSAKEKDPGRSFTFRKQAYRIPDNLEAESYQQWFDAEHTYLPACKTEMEAIATALSIFCLAEGEDYAAMNIQDRKALFMGLPCSIALGVSAFFFGRSKRYTKSINRCLNILRKSRLPWSVPGSTNTSEGMAASSP